MRAENLLWKMRDLELRYPGCETIQLIGSYIDNHVEDTLEREEECHNERLSGIEKCLKELQFLGDILPLLVLNF